MKKIIGVVIISAVVGVSFTMTIITTAMKHGAGAALALVGIIALLLLGSWLITSDD